MTDSTFGPDRRSPSKLAADLAADVERILDGAPSGNPAVDLAAELAASGTPFHITLTRGEAEMQLHLGDAEPVSLDEDGAANLARLVHDLDQDPPVYKC